MRAAAVVLVYAFDPIDELGGVTGVQPVPDELAGRLIAEFRAELIESHLNDSQRFVAGSPQHEAARLALRARRGEVGVRKVQRAPKLERA